MAAGKPVVATDCGGPQSIITAPCLGFIVKRGNSAELAKAMTQVFVNRKNYESKKIISECKKKYSEATYLKNLCSVYAL